MSIDPVMLGLSVANPGLLPLAVRPDNLSIPSMDRSGHVTHSGKIEHEFVKGSGEELRGHKANRDLIAQAYKTAIEDIEEIVKDKADLISKYDAKINAKRTSEQEERDKKYAAKELKKSNYEETKKVVEILENEERTAPKKRWGGKIFDYAKLYEAKNKHEEAKEKYFDYGVSALACFYTSLNFMRYERTATDRLNEAKEEVFKKKAILDLTDGELFLSKEELLECNDMFNHKWQKIVYINHVISWKPND